ncbi:bifunctional phosphoribosyl-AMP cyclohydrolase/phosphoribosyl-ATP diphosphatase HisIE [Lutispora sp.]|uniref:bifunctional phosphoribosyl-AMP cyclohydrolase/phosphoribosyl-ATP diphosphatase HisIE n=1 Tax=Lutispora sp. TaxID=2828727 RepID=UPI000EEB2C99|nr:bifunctional phosphoribosyl-AMP cyclohydrolase/phosphoribosyl-ATP diphosphatase HisIE [Lutispora sp.]MEA4960786.1 bifunctional phosphoribosyl-AMP cyclohydrolase/phosphoribosyl-ATP diphosphatase HisIE [Lutispora sp.]HCJ58490.1 bifunctional phosphoribosyl-AMP cyclohydrolase/phosphoribosyl-ATP pyrophosphatase [Clostridiaceae bacterium]
MEMDIDKIIEEIKFDDRGLVPAITQDAETQKVLMLAYMNKESIRKTLEERETWYFSRSRQKLWKKGETSGNIQKVKGFYYDCDKDSILLVVEQRGAACHTGEFSCFFNEALKPENGKTDILKELYGLLEDRKKNPIEGSYTNYLFEKGLDKILKKVGEETSEVIIAAKNKSKEELVYELSDLVYHVLVLMVNENVGIEDIKEELISRREK